LDTELDAITPLTMPPATAPTLGKEHLDLEEGDAFLSSQNEHVYVPHQPLTHWPSRIFIFLAGLSTSIPLGAQS
jgi:hypothetical protein